MKLLIFLIFLVCALVEAKLTHFQRHVKREAQLASWKNDYRRTSNDPTPTAISHNPQQYFAIPKLANFGFSIPAKSVAENTNMKQLAEGQVYNAFQQSANAPTMNYYQGVQAQIYQPTASPSQLYFNPTQPGYLNPLVSQPENVINAQQLDVASAQVSPVQHSSVINHSPYTHFSIFRPQNEEHQPRVNVQPTQSPQRQSYVPIQLNLKAQPYLAPQQQLRAPYHPHQQQHAYNPYSEIQKLPHGQSQPQHGPQQYNPYSQTQQTPPQSQPLQNHQFYNLYSQTQKSLQPLLAVTPSSQYNQLPPITTPYSAPNKAPAQNYRFQPVANPAALPVAKPQAYHTVVTNPQSHREPIRGSPREDVRVSPREDVKNTENEEDDDEDGYEDEEDDREISRYRNEDEDSAEEDDSTEYRPTFQAARYIFNNHESEEEEDEDKEDSSRRGTYVYPKNNKYYKYDETPFSKYYGNEHNRFTDRYKSKSHKYKPHKSEEYNEGEAGYKRSKYSKFNDEPTYELEGKQSQNIPMALRDQKLVKEKWFVTKKSRKEE